MAKPLDPKAIEAERQTSSRAERREQKRRQMQDEISYNQRGNGVIIPPQKRRELAEEPSKLRVAAYCRVSTQEEQQVGSFDMQIHHFTKRIEANPQWELVEIYQDEGISATTVEKRLGFQEMIADAVDGKIDLILTKSISRFGRNIVETVVLLSRETNPLTVEVRMEVETGEVKEHPTYKRIQEYVQEKYGFKVHTAYIAEVKRMVGLDMHKAPNAVEQKKHEYHPCPPEKVEAIKDALRHFGLISE